MECTTKTQTPTILEKVSDDCDDIFEKVSDDQSLTIVMIIENLKLCWKWRTLQSNRTP